VPQTAGGAPDHDAILEDALRAAGVPPHRLDSGHLVAAADLMAKEGLAPEDAYDRVMLQAAHVSGLVDPDDWQHLHGFAVDDEAQPTSAPPDETPQPRDFKAWPTGQAPTTEGRETGPYDSGASPLDPGVTLAAGGTRPGPDWRALTEILRQLFRGLNPQQPPTQQQPPPQTQPPPQQAPALQPVPQAPQQPPPQSLAPTPQQPKPSQPPQPQPEQRPQPVQTPPPEVPQQPAAQAPQLPLQSPPPQQPPSAETDVPPSPPVEDKTDDFGQRPDVGGTARSGSVVTPVQPRYQSPAEILAPGGKLIGRPGENSGIRELPGGAAAAQELFERLTQRGVEATPPTYRGVRFHFPQGGGFIGLRLKSTSGPPTIDVRIPGLRLKLKFPKG
jgi:hypothetical protein